MPVTSFNFLLRDNGLLEFSNSSLFNLSLAYFLTFLSYDMEAKQRRMSYDASLKYKLILYAEK
ncbi:hypothetical protein C0J52_03099 [Blattella germanica]|nr:hypothetical protein C0J52_03099 [Blattella germanica]